jgi:vancomycin resistance protein YoaR
MDPELKALGIREVLGVGVSRFAGSPNNRIKNIQNGAVKLNGLLIPPDGIFSTISTTQPFTIEGGYLPELVIKGSKLVPELGGGLCQIGTTLFRMAMNSGMEITERRNHSLVVSYYNDLSNGLPGTDATIYEPAPDFRFKNDTGHHVLIEANVNTQTGDLVFTLWGTNDGRKGFYDPPQVLRWIPSGPKQVIPSPDLPEGKENCQKAYRGAETTFTYHRTLADGTVEDVDFKSLYRPLPEICLVGGAGVSSTPALPTEGAPAEGDEVIPPQEFTFPNPETT